MLNVLKTTYYVLAVISVLVRMIISVKKNKK
jgi:hypothetical protein